MTEQCGNIYKTCRDNAGFTQEQAVEFLGVETRTLSSYENGHSRVPDDIVATMADKYNAPLLAWRHLKETSVLGRYLPEIVMPQTNGDMAFQLWCADKELAPVVEAIRSIISDGDIGEDERKDFDQSIEMVKQVNAKLLSVIVYAGKSV
jgi:transcriptional regulator with XRE-family HTH domain